MLKMLGKYAEHFLCLKIQIKYTNILNIGVFYTCKRYAVL